VLRILCGVLAGLLLVGGAPAVLGAATGVPPASLADLTPGTSGVVVAVVDGDTVLLEDGREVRLVGIQAPKLPLGRKNFAEWPVADQARTELESLVQGRVVSLFYGGEQVDRHGRQLAHLATEDGLWVQGEMLRRGLARVYSFADNRSLVGQMLAEEKAARDDRLGIWGNPFYAIRRPGSLARDIGTFQIVEGTVLQVSETRGTVYINFGPDWRTDFTIFLRSAMLETFAQAGLDVMALAGTKVRVRGWLDKRNGPAIEATHPEQIEIVPAPEPGRP